MRGGGTPVPDRRTPHYELILPNPVTGPNPKRPDSLPLTIDSTETSWLEVQRVPTGKLRFVLGADTEATLALAFEALRRGWPELALGRRRGCPAWALGGPSSPACRAVPLIRDRFTSTLRVVDAFDAGSLLLRQLSRLRSPDANVVLQFLFRPTFRWEMGRFSGPWWGLARDRADPRGTLLNQRPPDFPFHVEIRAAAAGVSLGRLAALVEPWLHEWTSTSGSVWWTLTPPKRRQEEELRRAIFAHDIFRLASPRCRRDLSVGEMAAVLPFPWKERHPNVAYAGAPEGRPPVELTADRMTSDRQLILGTVGRDPVRLPDLWHHLAVVGKTGAGKSTLIRSIVLQVLEKEPDARVVVLEPTGDLIEGIVGRLPPKVAADTIEIDPSRPSLGPDGQEQIAVPLNLLARPDPAAMSVSERERRAEKIVGDLLQAIKNAWGPESVGGRADLTLRGFVQPLLPLEGSTLVDVDEALTDKGACARLERLRLHDHPIPRLGPDFTISSVDKVGKIAGNPLLRKALCQRFGTVRFEDLLRHRLVLLNLRDGHIGTEGANFLGAILLSQLWSALQERVGVAANGPPPAPVYLVVDEFQHYAIPAFERMLSEGRGLGLRVIAATQTLEAIPDGVRPAIETNADAWVMFPLGEKDRRAAWKSLQGNQFGWQIDDFAEGPLRPHQAAYFASGTLLKLTTEAPTPAPVAATDRRVAVDRSSRRYAKPEDSQISPLGVNQSQRIGLLGALSPEEGTRLEELVKVLGWDTPTICAAIAVSLATGDAVRDAAGQIRLLPRGRYYRAAALAARNEGEEHCGLLADVLAYLSGFDIEAQIGVQQRVVETPDASFERGGRGYNVEVECSNLTKHPQQVVANVRKARSAGRRCLIAVSDPQAAEQVAVLVRARLAEIELWGEFGVVWRGAPGVMVPFSGAGAVEVWGWLLGMEERGPVAGLSTSPANPDRTLRATPTPQHELEVLGRLIAQLLKLGKEWVSAKEIMEAREGSERLDFDERRVGYLLAALRIPNRRVRAGDGQVRLYRITEFIGPGS